MAPAEPRVLDIAHVIQAAVAPVFLLTGVSATLGVLTNRLARVIDRARLFEAEYAAAADAGVRSDFRDRLAALAQRSHVINLAITLCTVSAVLVCAVIATLFVAAMLDLDASRLVAALFIGTMLTLTGAFATFLREIYLAVRTVRIIPPEPERA
jgi:hypothetical protein